MGEHLLDIQDIYIRSRNGEMLRVKDIKNISVFYGTNGNSISVDFNSVETVDRDGINENDFVNLLLEDGEDNG